AAVVRVHKDIGAGLNLVVDTATRLDFVGAGAATADDRAWKTVALEQRHGLGGYGCGLSGGIVSLSGITNVLGTSLIGLEPRKAEIAHLGDRAGEIERGLSWRHAAAFRSDVD